MKRGKAPIAVSQRLVLAFTAAVFLAACAERAEESVKLAAQAGCEIMPFQEGYGACEVGVAHEDCSCEVGVAQHDWGESCRRAHPKTVVVVPVVGVVVVARRSGDRLAP